MSTVLQRLAELGRPLPTAAAPLAAYVPATRTGSLVYTAGQLPSSMARFHAAGLVRGDADDAVVDGWVIDAGLVDIETAKECAAIAALNAIAAVHTVVEDLDSIVRIVKMTGFVAGVPGFTGHPQVVNGASGCWVRCGAQRARMRGQQLVSASLPLNAPVEIELIVEVSNADG